MKQIYLKVKSKQKKVAHVNLNYTNEVIYKTILFQVVEILIEYVTHFY
jgi:hypothetical protein